MAVEEMIDVLDQEGNPTGESQTLTDLHDKELWHGVAHIWIYNKSGQMLLQRRYPGKSWGADTWDLAAGGHISAGESPLQGAVREAKEELGLDVDAGTLVFAGKTTAISITSEKNLQHKAYEWNYIINLNVDLTSLKLQESETAEVKWFEIDSLLEELKTNPHKFAPRDIELFQLVVNKINEEL